jgi:alpha-tubulin suppressor-like RCC1 family protein
MLIPQLRNIVDIGGGCFQSIAVDATGQIFTFGDNPSGQLGIGNYSRCYSPKLMPLDMNGVMSNDFRSSQKESHSSLKKDSIFNGEFLLKVLKYFVFLSSIVLNIVLFRKLRYKR